MQFSKQEQQAVLAYATALRQAGTLVSPARGAYEKARAAVERQRSASGSAQLAVADIERDIARLQEDGQKLRRRLADDRAQLATVTDVEARRDLEHDVVSTTNRITDLTAEIQEAHNEVHALRVNADKHQQLLVDAERALATAQAELEAQQAVDPAEVLRALKEQVPAQLLALFEEQHSLNGVGVASFQGRSCGGCFLVLSPGDIRVITTAPADDLPQCPECGSYLVR